ncbi:hypothetical protein B566_EDAN008577 [Ephemera danica]|nr:hypothetical protein B566_EDAN008577 [Ephemera danica]
MEPRNEPRAMQFAVEPSALAPLARSSHTLLLLQPQNQTPAQTCGVRRSQPCSVEHCHLDIVCFWLKPLDLVAQNYMSGLGFHQLSNKIRVVAAANGKSWDGP